MSKYFAIFLLILFSACSTSKKSVSTIKTSYAPPIPFAPKKYVCQSAIDPIKIDGLGNEESWQAAQWTDDFVDIEGHLKPNPFLNTRTKMLWDEEYFYFFAKMEEPHIWAKLTERDAVIYQDDDFEIFIDPDGDAHNYYEFEVNALNTMWDLFMMWPYRHKVNPNYLFNWNVDKMKHAVHVEGSVNDPSDIDKYWTVEIAIPWSALKEMARKAKPPKAGDQWRVNFSRVDWTVEDKAGIYEKVKDSNGKNLSENNWVWSPQGAIAMHMPEWWGYVQFSKDKAGTNSDPIKLSSDEDVKWALWNLYFQQSEYFEKHGSYLTKIEQFTIPILENCEFSPSFFAGKVNFEISANSCNGKKLWTIDQMGKIKSTRL